MRCVYGLEIPEYKDIKAINDPIENTDFINCVFNLRMIEFNAPISHCVFRHCVFKGFGGCLDLFIEDCSFISCIFSDMTLVKGSLSDLEFTDCQFCFIHGESDAKQFNLKFNNCRTDGNMHGLNVESVCPEKGSFTGWKVVRDHEDQSILYLIKLRIPEDAKRFSALSNKCRCDKAFVEKIYDLSNMKLVNTVVNVSDTRASCTYTVNNYVYPDDFDNCRWYECAHGIHFFMTIDECVQYACYNYYAIQIKNNAEKIKEIEK